MKLTIHLQLVPGLSKGQVIPSPSHMPLYNAQGQLYVYASLYLTNIRNDFPEDKDIQKVNLPIRCRTYAAFFPQYAKTTLCSDIVLTSPLLMQKTVRVAMTCEISIVTGVWISHLVIFNVSQRKQTLKNINRGIFIPSNIKNF
jgi:hypothetical protein